MIELTLEGRRLMDSSAGTSHDINQNLKQFYLDMKDKTGLPAWEIKKSFFNALGNTAQAEVELRKEWNLT